jgi:hypothetical protein
MITNCLSVCRLEVVVNSEESKRPQFQGTSHASTISFVIAVAVRIWRVSVAVAVAVVVAVLSLAWWDRRVQGSNRSIGPNCTDACGDNNSGDIKSVRRLCHSALQHLLLKFDLLVIHRRRTGNKQRVQL